MKVLFIAPIDKFALQDSGYGTAAAGIYYVLTRMEKEGKIDKLYVMNTQSPDKKDIPQEQVDVSITVAHPHSFLRAHRGIETVIKAINTAKLRYLSVVWETDRLPKVWSKVFDHDLFHGFITPSFFVADLIRKVTSKPVYYYPHYLHTEDIPQVNIEQKLNEKWFTVLYIGQDTKRKGLEDAVVSFIRALGNAPDARLVLKYHRLSNKELDTQQMIYHSTITNTAKPKSRVYSITEMLPRDRMYSLYHMSSVLLFPSRGEGFGLPVGEAMSAGLPIIYTAWSSIPEVAAAEGNIPLRYIVDESVGMFHHGYDIWSRYAIPLMQDTMDAIRAKYIMWKQDKAAYYGQVTGSRAIIEEKFGYETVSRCIDHFIHEREGFTPDDIAERIKYGQEVFRNYNILERSERGERAEPAPELRSSTDKSDEDFGLVCEDCDDDSHIQPTSTCGIYPELNQTDSEEGHE